MFIILKVDTELAKHMVRNQGLKTRLLFNEVTVERSHRRRARSDSAPSQNRDFIQSTVTGGPWQAAAQPALFLLIAPPNGPH